MRFHDLDALRAFAMSLGVVLHGAVFLVSAGEWPVKDAWSNTVEDTANPYAFLILIIHGFRMQTFFLLSGFFTAMLWQSRGLLRLAKHRFQRIVVPLLIGMLTIIPINTLLFEGPSFNPLTEWGVAWLTGFDHLWFLWFLIWMIGIFFLLTLVGVKFTSRLWWLLIPLTVVPMYFMEEAVFGADTLEIITLVWPPVNILVYYALFFFFGVFFFQKKFQIQKWWTYFIIPCLLIAFPVSLLLIFPEMLLESTSSNWTWLGAAVLQTVYSWLMCFGMMGLFHMIAHKERFWIRYMSDASYWIYLWHLPLIILGQMMIVSWAVNPHLKFIVLCTIVLAVLLVTYQTGVRYSVIGTLLNGPRKRRLTGIANQ